MKHVNRPMTELSTFQVTLRDLVKLQGNKFVVDVTNEPHRTYFHGPAWSHMTEVLKMEPETKCYFYMEQGRPHSADIYFHYKLNEEEPSSDDSSDDLVITLAGADE